MAGTALLVMDVQRGIAERFEADRAYLQRIADAIGAAHATHIPVIYVMVAFRAGHPEVSERNLGFSTMAGTARLVESETATQIHPAITPLEGDLVVVKKRVSAFAGSDLEVLLRAREIDSLVLAGIATSGVVLSTVRQAADLDYRLIVLADGCIDADGEVHRVLTEKVFPRQARVMNVDEWCRETVSTAQHPDH